VQRKTSGNNVSASGLQKWGIVLALVVVFGIAGSACSKKDSASENTENGNANDTASTTSPSPTATDTATDTTTDTATNTATNTATDTSAPAKFQGTWVNKDPNTRGNTKLVITQNGPELQVHAWGKCHPADCDWGEQKGGIIDDVGVVTWDQKFVIRKMKLTLKGNNQLRAVTESVYNDKRPRRRSEEVFVKQS
jgi:hypothetical protein